MNVRKWVRDDVHALRLPVYDAPGMGNVWVDEKTVVYCNWGIAQRAPKLS